MKSCADKVVLTVLDPPKSLQCIMEYIKAFGSFLGQNLQGKKDKNYNEHFKARRRYYKDYRMPSNQ